MTTTLTQPNEVFYREALGLKGKLVDAEQHAIYYETASNSESPERTFVLAHGAACTGRFMNPIAHKIIKTIPNSKVIVLDLPFHGYSTTNESINGYTIDGYTGVTIDVVNKLKAEKEIIGTLNWIGWSMGGSIGLLTSIASNSIDELTLLNSAPVWESIGGLLAAEPLMSNESAIPEVFKSICENDIGSKTDVEFQETFAASYYDIVSSGKVMVNDLKVITPEYYDVREQLAEVNSKTLIISGTNDGLAEVKYQQLMEQLIPDAELLLLEDNHCLIVKPYAVEIVVKAIADRFTK